MEGRHSGSGSARAAGNSAGHFTKPAKET